jgi:hypothetical protein
MHVVDLVEHGVLEQERGREELAEAVKGALDVLAVDFEVERRVHHA